MLRTGSLIGLFNPVLCFILHILVYRLWPGSHRVPRQKLTLLIILVAVLLSSLAALLVTGDVREAAQATVVSLLFGYTYFHWFNMSETARRIRLLVRYVALGLSPESHQDAYNSETILNNRLQRLVETGAIVREGDKYLAHRGPLLWATRLILFWRSLFFAN